MSFSPLQQEAARELLIRRKARADILHYVSAIEVPGKPIGEDETDVFAPIETQLADHHRLMLTKLDEISKTPHGRMMIFMPPGSAKSTYASVVFPSRYLGEAPNRKVILASYGDDLARKMGRRTRAIIKQKRYKAIFDTGLGQESQAAQEFSLTNGSEYMACGILGGVTGNRANGIIIDDPIKGREQADSETIRNKTFEAYEDDLKTRLIPGGWIVIIQTRWHEDDLAGRILPTNWKGESGKVLCRDGNEWEVICLQAKCEVENDPLGREQGEYLWPEWFDKKHWEQFEKNSRTWSALYQQLPVPRGGIIFNRNHWKFYKELPEMDEITISVDCTFKETTNSDYVAIQAWGNKGANDYLLKRTKERMGFAATVLAVRAMKALYPEAVAILIEDKANGSAVIETLSGEISGILAIQPEGGKVARAYAAQPAQEAGNVFLPDPSIDPDIETFLSEISSFPAAPHDDEVDSCTQYLNWRRVRSKSFGLVEYMKQQAEALKQQ